MTARGAGAWRVLPLLAVVAIAVAWRGAYSEASHSGVAALAGVAAVVAIAVAPTEAARASRAPVVLTLTALALLTALSAAWTIGAPAIAVRNGAAVLAIAAVIVVATTLPPPWPQAGLLLAGGVTVAIAGVIAAIAGTDPQALEICGTWRPAGPFEYPPALALVCAGALPPALALTGLGGRRGLPAAGAATGWLLATAVALTANRLGVALAGAALVTTVWLAPREQSLGRLALGVIVSAAASTLIVGADLHAASAAQLVLALVPPLVLCALAGRAQSQAPRGRWLVIVAIAAVVAVAGSVIADRQVGCKGELTHGRIGIWRAGIKTAADRPLEGFGSGTFLAASRAHQLKERPIPTKFAHDLQLESWVELGVAGLLLVAAWYGAVAALLLRTVRASRTCAYVLVPAAAAFPLANLLDWPWHLLGAGILWAVAAGGLVACSEVGVRR